ncbi:MAG: recombinase family protein [Lachnospirales bacterium]
MFKTAIYCRLSHDDLNKQSESIENQQLIIKNYIQTHSGEFEIVDTFIDDGISGMIYDRAAFNLMMEAVNEGLVNCIIVKDLSRIGREQVETLNLIRKQFVLRNIRFIAITDDYDSFNPSKSDGLSTSVKLLLNDYYCADISKKVRSAQKAKRRKGDFIGSFAPYGYKKSPDDKNKLVIDEEAAEVVRKIFNMYIGGLGKVSIARALNKEGILNPTMYKRSILNENYKNSNRLSSTGYWTYSTINKILSNEVYIGNMVQHKSQIKAYNIRKKVQVPKKEWCVVYNTHDAIISKEDFFIVKNMLLSKRRNLNLTDNTSKYTGLFFCKECGRAMNKFLSKPRKDGSRYITFKCGSYSSLGKDICTIHSIKETELDYIILSEIKRHIKIALDNEACEYIKKATISELKSKDEDKLTKLRANLEKCSQKRKNMLNHLSEDIIDINDFKEFDASNKEEVKKIKENIALLEEKLKDENRQIEEYNSWLLRLLEYKDVEEITREILVNLVDKIYISEKGGEKEIEIVFKFKNPLE